MPVPLTLPKAPFVLLSLSLLSPAMMPHCMDLVFTGPMGSMFQRGCRCCAYIQHPPVLKVFCLLPVYLFLAPHLPWRCGLMVYRNEGKSYHLQIRNIWYQPCSVLHQYSSNAINGHMSNLVSKQYIFKHHSLCSALHLVGFAVLFLFFLSFRF